MTEPVNIIGEYYSIGIPEGILVPRIEKRVVCYFTAQTDMVKMDDGSFSVSSDCSKLIKNIYKLPPGKWSIVSTSDKMTEEHAEKIVDREVGHGYQNYGNPFKPQCPTALKSFKSLLKSHGLEGRQLILKQESGEQNQSTQNK